MMDNKTLWINCIKASAIRALYTFLEVFLIGLPTCGTVFDVDWYDLFGIAALATIAAFIKSMLAGMPEAESPIRMKMES